MAVLEGILMVFELILTDEDRQQLLIALNRAGEAIARHHLDQAKWQVTEGNGLLDQQQRWLEGFTRRVKNLAPR
jgi:hypothetical protein